MSGDSLLTNVVRTSYSNLQPGAKRAFRLLGLLDAPSFAEWLPAALLTVPGGEAETHIEALIDAQLLICEGTDPNGQLRYRFHDLVRLYARERAEEEDGDQRRTALTRALSGWLALAEAADHQLTERLASDIRGRAPRWSLNPDKIRALTADPLAWFDSERAALRACVSQAAAAGLDELAWELASCTASYYAFRGLYEDWSGTHQTALQACTSSANRRGVAVMLRNLGCLRMTGIETSAGVLARRADTAVGIFRELGELRGEVDGLVLHSFALQHTGHLDQALACRDAAMGLAQLTGYELGKCRLWYLHAVVDRHQGNYEQAAAAAQRCLRMAKRVGTAHDRVLALWELTAACRDRDAFRATGQDLHEGLELCRRRGERLLEAYLLLARAGLYLRFGQDGARASVEQALAVFGEHRVLYGQAVGLRLLGEVEHGEERPAHALVSLTQAVEATRKLRDGYEHALALKALGAVYRTCGDDQAAGRAWAEARRLFTRLATATATRAFPAAPSNTLPGMTSRR